MMNSRSVYPQLSIWSTEHVSDSQHHQHTFNNSIQSKRKSSTIHYVDHVTNEDSTNNEKQRYCLLSKFYRYCSSIPPCLQGLLLGLLTGSSILSIVIALWLTSSNQTKITTKAFIQVSTATTLHIGWNSTAATVVGSASSMGTSATQLSGPVALAIDSSRTLYIADRDNNRVQKWLNGASSGTTVAGSASGTPGSTVNYLYTPRDVELDASGNTYIPDSANHRVVFWVAGASSCTVVAGNGTAGSANNQLNNPYGVAHDWNTAILYVADSFNDRIMSYASGASTGSMVIGGTGTGSTQLYLPTGLYFDLSSNSLYIANSHANNIVRWVVGASNWILVAGSISGSSGSTSSLLSYPRDVTFDSMGNVYVADTNNQRIQFFMAGQSNGITIAGVTGAPGNTSTLLNSPASLVVDSQFNVYVADLSNNRVQRFDHY